MTVALPHLLDQTLPDAAHEALRLAFHQALDNLAQQSVSMDDFRLALQTLAKLASDYLAAVQASVADRKQLNDRVAVLEAMVSALQAALASAAARISALEQKPAVRNVAVAPPVSLGLLSIGSRDVTLPLDRTLPDANWEPEYWPSPGLLGSATFTTKSKTTNSVVVTVRNTALIAAGGSLGAIAVRTA